ncbi:hypothetical protein ABL78_1064 [Leptomonas seymouri]|uniref:Uncharacterized protein n=1 Tax=Leptomonas seymouri TaxID=5684 RepID=A0A0N1IB45_LEPSE|nr:hypothetical protein ABL78_1064 [Leptomonas seymouri]|eukprot:KPI89801.1 hypothetical protein ABL78_1064 [Leptomonas seymouri]
MTPAGMSGISPSAIPATWRPLPHSIFKSSRSNSNDAAVSKEPSDVTLANRRPIPTVTPRTAPEPSPSSSPPTSPYAQSLFSSRPAAEVAHQSDSQLHRSLQKTAEVCAQLWDVTRTSV